jgi:hypothetical protein
MTNPASNVKHLHGVAESPPPNTSPQKFFVPPIVSALDKLFC